jgi:hypothetical protein
MDSDSVSQISSEDPTTIEETAAALMPMMDGLIRDMRIIETKVDASKEDMYKQVVRPLPGVMRNVWTILDLPPTMEFDALLERIFASAERLEAASRTMYFPDKMALIFGKSQVVLYELIDTLVDGLEFVVPA